MKYLSLFTGIGGFELGIQRAYEQKNRGVDGAGGQDNPVSGGQETLDGAGMGDSHPEGSSLRPDENSPACVGYSEIDKYAIQIYERHFDHPSWGDITSLDPARLPDFDLICGGFPCQAFSIAGKRKGFDDTRGTLFFEIARILREKRPRLLLLENVKGLLSHAGGNTFATIVATLDELGYDLQWQVLNSKDFGVPQNRERVFIVGHLRGTSRPQVFPFGEIEGDATSGSGEGEDAAACLTGSYGDNGRGTHVIGTIDHGRFRQTENANTIPATYHKGHDNHGARPMVLVPEATQKGYAEATVGQAINLAVPNSKTRRGRVSDVAQTLDTGMQQYTLSPDAQIRRLTPVECERLQGLPDGWTEGVSDTQRYKCLGNAVTVNVIEAIVSRMI